MTSPIKVVLSTIFPDMINHYATNKHNWIAFYFVGYILQNVCNKERFRMI
jgi:hypothetical protein